MVESIMGVLLIVAGIVADMMRRGWKASDEEVMRLTKENDELKKRRADGFASDNPSGMFNG